MSALTLDREAQHYRKVLVPQTGQYVDTLIAPSVRCAIVPVSTLDQDVAYAYEATHVLWVEHWLTLRKDDELRWGLRPPDVEGNIQPWIFTIKGRRDFHMGVPQSSYYARERE